MRICLSPLINMTTSTSLAQFHLLPTTVSGAVCTSFPWCQFFSGLLQPRTFLSHLTEGGYCSNVLSLPGIDMYQMYIVTPMVKARVTYVGVGLIYKPHGLFAGGVQRCATFLRTFFDRCESEINMAPSQAYFLQKRRGVGPLCQPTPTWICVDSITPCPGVIDKEGADMVGIHSSQTITFRMMIALIHFFHGIQEEHMSSFHFKHPRDNRSLWRTGFFSYLDGVWEWVQVTCDQWLTTIQL